MSRQYYEANPNWFVRKDIHDEVLAENDRLKAEVEEARKISGEGMSVTLDLNNQLCAENARLQAEVERLTKAGDAMAEQLDGLSFDSVWDFWNAAKEGKQS